MNKVSEINLAVAVHEAGAVPSISFVHGGHLDINFFKKTLLDFKDRTSGSTKIILSFSWEDILRQDIVDFLLNQNFKFIEIFHRPINDALWPVMTMHLDFLKKQGIYVIAKTLKAITKVDYDIVILKGSEGAGRTLQDSGTLEENFNIYKKEKPNTKVIPSGGIYSKEQVNYYMAKGAEAIGIGTLFALSEESCVSIETKKEILKTNSEMIQLQGKHNHRGIVFSQIDNDDDNNTQALIKGISSPNEGMLFTGNGIDFIKSIKPVKEIILELMGE